MSSSSTQQQALPNESELFAASRLARIEILSNLNASQLSELCRTSKRSALVICGQGQPPVATFAANLTPAYALGSGENKVLISDSEVLHEVWEALLQRDYGLSPQSRYCTAFTLFERRLVAASMQRWQIGVQTNLERLRRWRSLYKELYALANEPKTSGGRKQYLPIKAMFVADGIAIQRNLPQEDELACASIVDLIASKAPYNYNTQSVLFKVADGQRVERLDVPQLHTGAYVASTATSSTLYVCRSDDFWRIPLPRLATWKVYVDPREPSMVYVATETDATVVFAVDLDLPEAALIQVSLPQLRTLSFAQPSTSTLITNKLVLGVGGEGEFRVEAPRFQTSFRVPSFIKRYFNLAEATSLRIYLVPVVKPTWSNDQRSRFDVTVLCLAEQELPVKPPLPNGYFGWRTSLIVFQLNAEQKIVAPPLVYPVLFENHIHGIWRTGPSTVLLTRSFINPGESLAIDWATGLYATFRKSVFLSRRERGFGGYKSENFAWMAPPAGDLWASGGDEREPTNFTSVIRQPAQVAKVEE